MPPMTPDWTEAARHRLLDLRRGAGAWGYRARSIPAAEPSLLAAMALLAPRGDGPDDASKAAALASARRLASVRRPDGSVGVSAELPEPGWPTPLAVLLWSSLGGFEAERRDALGWLIGLRGKTIARVANDPMGHNASLVGWPWVAGTHSWVEPTAMALMALAREGKSAHPRATEGVRVLLDRAIPGGGWNLGNPVVFGTTLRPLPGPTGLALLALAAMGVRDSAVDEAIAYLGHALPLTLAPVSLGWGLLGLRAWGVRPDWADARLEAAFRASEAGEPRPVELALSLLAASGRSTEILGVSGRETVATATPLDPSEAPSHE
jgi:hypothetical protein